MSIKFRINHSKIAGSKIADSFKSIYLKGNRNTGVFLIHGLTGTPNEMLFLARQFQEEGYSSFCPALYKHGQPMDEIKYCRWQDFYSFLKKDFIEFRSSFSPRPIFVGGLSMGALLALLLTYDFPEDISGVIALAPTLFFDGWNMPWTRVLLPLAYFAPLKYFFYFKEEPPYGIKSKIIRRHVERYYKQADLDDLREIDKYGYPFIPVSLMYQLDKLARHLIGVLPHIKTPIQLIQARNDDLSSPRNSHIIYERIGAEDKELIFLNDSYHMITADQERNKVVKYMEDFVEEHNLD